MRKGAQFPPEQKSLIELFSHEGRCQKCDEKDGEIAVLKARLKEHEDREEAEDARRQRSLMAAVQKWQEFHTENPKVWRAILDICKTLKRQERDHYGIGAVWEELRYHRLLTIAEAEPFKLSHDHRSVYSWMLADLFPEYGRLFSRKDSGRMADLRPWRDLWVGNPAQQESDLTPP